MRRQGHLRVEGSRRATRRIRRRDVADRGTPASNDVSLRSAGPSRRANEIERACRPYLLRIARQCEYVHWSGG